MDGQAENVIIMPQVQPLGVLLSVVHDSNCSNVIDHFPSLRVEQIVSTVVASVTEAQVQEMHSSWMDSESTEQERLEDKAITLIGTCTSRTSGISRVAWDSNLQQGYKELWGHVRIL